MAAAIFILYLLLFSWLVTKVAFFKNSGINNKELIVLFILKVAAGLVYAWFYSLPAYKAGSDTWNFFKYSLDETNLLLQHPVTFIKDLFSYGYATSGNLFVGNNSYWNDLQENIIIKLLAVCNVFTFKNYYADIIFFNFLFMFGPVSLYKIVSGQTQINKYILICAIFLVPSFLFWCSGIHKDGLIFSALTICIYAFYKQLQQQKISVKLVVIFVACFLLIFALRSFIAILLSPALLVWWLITKYPVKTLLIISIVYAACIIIFFTSPLISNAINFPAYIATKQAEFKVLGGNSQLNLPDIQPSLTGIIKYFPYCIDVAFLQPHLNNISNKAYLPAILENILFYLLIFYALIIAIKQKFTANNFFIFCYCFALPNMLLAGYTITLTGAIVRYKSIFLPFIIVPLVVLVWQYVNKKFEVVK